jgi:hypothetical protein
MTHIERTLRKLRRHHDLIEDGPHSASVTHQIEKYKHRVRPERDARKEELRTQAAERKEERTWA